MSVTIKALACCSLLALAGMSVGHAQERSAAGNMENQMTWSTLSKLVDAANAKSSSANARMDQSIVCNKIFKSYAPGAAGADANGCIENQLILQLKSRMDVMDKTVGEINGKISNLEGRMTSAEGSIKKLDTSVADLTTKMTALTSRVGVVEKDVTALETKMATVEASIKTLNGKVTALEADMTAVEKRMGTAETNIKTNTADIKDLNTDLTALTKRVTTAEGTIKTHTAQIADINADIVAVNKLITALDKEMTALQADVKDNTTDITKIINCGKLGKTYNGTTCVLPAAAEVTIPRRWIWLKSNAFRNSLSSGTASENKIISDLNASYSGITECSGSVALLQARQCGDVAKYCYKLLTNTMHIGGDNDRDIFAGYSADVMSCQ